jgi:exosortase A-associated hydrolase 2
MRETPFFFPGAGHSLFGVLHEPEARPIRGAFLFCHPLAEEKLWAHRVFVSFARQLVQHGYMVLRFDYMGNGDSEGSFEESSLSTARADVLSALDQVRGRAGVARVGLLGLRLGATIASLVAEECDWIDRLILWAPIVDGNRYMQELLRTNLTTQMAIYKEIREDREALVEVMRRGGSVNVDGYEMTFPLFSEVAAVKLGTVDKRFAWPCLVTQLDRAPARPAPDLQQIVSTYSDGTLVFAQEEPFWKEIARFYNAAPNLFDVTLSWLRAQ